MNPPPHFLQPKKILKILKATGALRRTHSQWGTHPQFLNNAFLDPYRGCEFGCVYCYGIKETEVDEGSGYSPYKVSVKTSAAFCLKRELPSVFPVKTQSTTLPRGSPQLQSGASVAKGGFSLGLGFESDPYQAVEERYQLTLRCLEILKENECPFQILTKSELVLRDKKILCELSQKGLAIVSISIFTADEGLSKIFEPRAPEPQKRLELLTKLRDANIIAGAMLMPIFPYLTDEEEKIEELFYRLHSAGALYCVPGILTLAQPQVKKRIFQIIDEKFPKVLELYEALYDKLGHPALNYCERIRGILNRCSEKYQMPTVLPVEGVKEESSLIVKDTL